MFSLLASSLHSPYPHPTPSGSHPIVCGCYWDFISATITTPLNKMAVVFDFSSADIQSNGVIPSFFGVALDVPAVTSLFLKLLLLLPLLHQGLFPMLSAMVTTQALCPPLLLLWLPIQLPSTFACFTWPCRARTANPAKTKNHSFTPQFLIETAINRRNVISKLTQS